MLCFDVPFVPRQVHRLAVAINRSIAGRWARTKVALRETRVRARERRAVRRQVGQQRSQQGSKLRLPWRRHRDTAPEVVPDAAHDAAELGLARQKALDVQGAIAAYEVRSNTNTIALTPHIGCSASDAAHQSTITAALSRLIRY